MLTQKNTYKNFEHAKNVKCERIIYYSALHKTTLKQNNLLNLYLRIIN